MGNHGPLKLNDIARLAGVSRSTVSRVVNDDPRVSNEVRQRVQDTIAAVGYQPHAAARALASRRNGVIGMVIPEDFATVHSDPWFPPLIQAALEAARKADLSVMLLMEWINDPQAANRLLRRFVRPRTVDGMILTNSLVDDVLTEQLMGQSFPYVIVGRPYMDGRNFVDISNRDAAARITRHLLGHGWQRPAIINGPDYVMSARDRKEGFLDAITEAGFDPATVPMIAVQFSLPGAYAAAIELLSRDDRPDCIFAASDSIAINVMDAARRLGIRVPEDLGVVGFDDILPERNEHIGLTTVRQPVRELAGEAINQLTNLIHHRDEPPIHTWLETTLCIRRSCGCDVSLGTPADGAVRKEGTVASAR